MGTEESQVKFIDKSLGYRPGGAILVGINPGRQRLNERTGVAWEGNKSADFLLSCLDGAENILLTNVCNFQNMDRYQMVQGIRDLKWNLVAMDPGIVICLGEVPMKVVMSLEYRFNVHKLPHPSYIVRFNKDKKKYRDDLRKLLCLP